MAKKKNNKSKVIEKKSDGKINESKDAVVELQEVTEAGKPDQEIQQTDGDQNEMDGNPTDSSAAAGGKEGKTGTQEDSAQLKEEGIDTSKVKEEPKQHTSPDSNEPVEVHRNGEGEKESTDTVASQLKPKKRLTLQERLALAAKGKAKKQKLTSSASTPPPQESSLPSSPTPVQTPEFLSPVTSQDQEGFTNPDETVDPQQELRAVKAQFDQLRLENSSLSNQITLLRSKQPAQISNQASSSGWEKEKEEIQKKLKAKDETIEQLMEEGKSLSVKELKLNDSIKKLKGLNSNLEISLKDYSEKNEELSLELSELEATLKSNNLGSLGQLLDSFSHTKQDLSQAKSDLESELASNWQQKYQEELKHHNEEMAAKKKLLKELNELKIQSEMSKRQLMLEIDSKNSLNSDLKQEIVSLKQEHSDEITRLEGKIESLRLEIEYSNNTNEVTTGTMQPEDSLGGADIIDYEEFKKLSDNHQVLQQQYLSSQKNWNLIESNLLNKLDNLTSSVDSMKKSKLKLNNEMKELNEELTSKTEDYESLNQKFEDIKAENEELRLAINLKVSDISELQDKSEKLKQIYATERANLNTKITSLQESLNSIKSQPDSEKTDTQEDNLSSINRMSSSGLHINIDPPKFPLRGLSTTSIPETPTSYQASTWNEIRLGESSLTPNVNSSNLFMNANNSSTSFNDADESYDNNDNYSFRNNSFNHGSIVGTIPTGMNNSKIQLINKMSSNIRRLEIELNTLKEENAQLVHDKESTEKELLEKLKLAGDVDKLKAQMEDLQSELLKKDEHEQTMLELIGEKSEQVEELRADIIDLKDLCRLQVQQMIELQERK